MEFEMVFSETKLEKRLEVSHENTSSGKWIVNKNSNLFFMVIVDAHKQYMKINIKSKIE